MLNLGELIEALSRKPQEAEVMFDFVCFRPYGKIASWRGDYYQLALGYTSEYKYNHEKKVSENITVGQLIEVLKGALGKHHEGYKGGGGIATEDTKVWVDNWGECNHTFIADVEMLEDTCYLVTGITHM